MNSTTGRVFRLVMTLPGDAKGLYHSPHKVAYWPRTFQIINRGSSFEVNCNPPDGVLYRMTFKLGPTGGYYSCDLLTVGQALRTQILEVMDTLVRQNLLPEDAHLEVI